MSLFSLHNKYQMCLIIYLKTPTFRQLYATYQLIALDKDGGQVEDYFNLPSACICHHQDKQQSFLLRRLPIEPELPPLCDDKNLRIANFDSEESLQNFSVQTPVSYSYFCYLLHNSFILIK